jgi:iron(III) transport system substrate-binding protein
VSFMATKSSGRPVETDGRPVRPRTSTLIGAVLLGVTACGGADAGATDDESAPPGSLVLYTCLNDESIQPVIEAF